MTLNIEEIKLILMKQQEQNESILKKQEEHHESMLKETGNFDDNARNTSRKSRIWKLKTWIFLLYNQLQNPSFSECEFHNDAEADQTFTNWSEV
ncbi:hypothetical protein ACTXT7_007815 [Hymenolepis weldensis]